MNEKLKLTDYSRGSGCGCKIAPDVLQQILQKTTPSQKNAKLIVGNETNDDAAVLDIGNNLALISTVDFFMPMVNSAFDFGRIAAANAISDVYAMGGKPILATAILGWPIQNLPASLASEVISGARLVCNEANITLAGGHSVDNLEPLFGLSVNGLTHINNIKKNNTAKNGDLLYLTKKLGVGILSSALKREKLNENLTKNLIAQLTTLNSIGEKIGELNYVTAMTDVTGFGLIGHLIEMTENAGLSAEINFNAIQTIQGLEDCIAQGTIPDNLYRNWNSYEKEVENIGAFSFYPLNDPQTNGGLLIAVNPNHQSPFELFLSQNGLEEFSNPIGRIINEKDKRVIILNTK
ncbi:MAG: selenide, water dikinase SelD [Sphingobacteriaceae bacterium]|nr:selenide, water dikinase SelD [Sphingobacteriaceae bacterium]